MIRTIKKNGNDGLNWCSNSSQWNLCPLKSTTSFQQMWEREKEYGCLQVFIFILPWTLVKSKVFHWNCFTIDLLLLLFSIPIPSPPACFAVEWTATGWIIRRPGLDILCVSKKLPVFGMYLTSARTNTSSTSFFQDVSQHPISKCELYHESLCLNTFPLFVIFQALLLAENRVGCQTLLFHLNSTKTVFLIKSILMCIGKGKP